jgi:hypothetical protein
MGSGLSTDSGAGALGAGFASSAAMIELESPFDRRSIISSTERSMCVSLDRIFATIASSPSPAFASETIVSKDNGSAFAAVAQAISATAKNPALIDGPCIVYGRVLQMFMIKERTDFRPKWFKVKNLWGFKPAAELWPIGAKVSPLPLQPKSCQKWRFAQNYMHRPFGAGGSNDRRSQCLAKARTIAFADRPPCFQAFLLPLGAPGFMPPCIRHRLLPFHAWGWHSGPERVSAISAPALVQRDTLQHPRR